MTNQETAVAVVEQSPEAVVEYNLDNWPSESFNRLVPTQTLGMVTDLIRPIIQVVQLDTETDTYSSNDLPEGHRAPNVKGLSKLAAAAGVDFVDEERLDDGSDPMRAYVRVYAEVIDATGRKRRAPGSRDYQLNSQKMTDAQRNRAKGYVHEHAATRARHRALRALLGIAQSYPVAELRKPFAVVSLVPNLQNPELRERVRDAMVPTIAALYGPTQAKQISAGPEVVEVPEVEEKNVTPAPATPSKLPGEKLAKAEASSVPDEPDWMQEPAAKPKPVDLATRIRDTAAAAADPDARATADELATLREIFAGWDGKLVGAGIRALWDGQAPNDLGSGQALAIATIHDSLGHDAFERQWRSLAEKAAVAA